MFCRRRNPVCEPHFWASLGCFFERPPVGRRQSGLGSGSGPYFRVCRRVNIHWGNAGKRCREGSTLRRPLRFAVCTYSPAHHYSSQPMEAACAVSERSKRGPRGARLPSCAECLCHCATAEAGGRLRWIPCSLTMLTKWVQHARLETRTKETCAIASVWVRKPERETKVKGGSAS